MYTIENKELKPLFKEVNNIKEPYNHCRQNLPNTYLHNGYIDILNSEIVKKGSVSGGKIFPYLMSGDEYHDIDYENDFEEVEKIIRNF